MEPLSGRTPASIKVGTALGSVTPGFIGIPLTFDAFSGNLCSQKREKPFTGRLSPPGNTMGAGFCPRGSFPVHKTTPFTRGL